MAEGEPGRLVDVLDTRHTLHETVVRFVPEGLVDAVDDKSRDILHSHRFLFHRVNVFFG